MTRVKTHKREFAPSVPFKVEEHLQDTVVRAAYDALDEEFALIRQLIDLRQKHGLSQRQLAQRAGMQQPVIARLEGGRPASLGTLRRVAEALGAQLELRLVPQPSAKKQAHAPARVNSNKRSSTKRG